MDDDVGDYCAVCADNIDFVAYGICGHKQVCSNCVVRLRFVCKDKRCCICKTESDVVFVTKALGDYTCKITDFSALSRNGSYKYHEESQAYFDDKHHFNEVMELCNLSCVVCEKSEVAGETPTFRHPDKLREHIFEEHDLLMCSFCIEGRKKFIQEQKLFTREGLKRHINVGDSKDEDGFTGHPECNLCRKRFYGDSELALHKHTQHFSCFLCQRRNPNGKIEYFKEYDDLEAHFTRDHYLCRDKACLAKKFIVFPSEFELKRHVNKEHGGEVCNAVPTGFRTQPRNNRTRSEEDVVTTTSEDVELPSNVPIIQPYDFPALPNAPKRAVQEQRPLQIKDGIRNTMVGKIHGKFSSPSSFPTLAASLSIQTSVGSSSSSQSGTTTSQAAVSKPASSSQTRSWLAPGKPTTRSLRASGKKPAAPTKEEIQNAAKSSVLQQIRVCLDYDEGKFSAFEEMSSKYNVGAIEADAYLDQVEKFGLSHMVFELVKLCLDSQKQRKLLERHNANLKGKKELGARW